ncbi:MAG TPA: hypothetical protein VMN03_04210 [Burkholderiales bacterium]|nr:hypothetical protein [Burkholderiales bacterium]
MQNSLTLDDLLARDVAIKWFEGVALVQEVCRQILAAAGNAFPTPPNVLLSANGSVSILRKSASGDTVANAARMLAGMESDDFPVQLRLLVSQATGSESAYPALGDFSSALAFFERPDPQHILRQLYERAMLAPAREQAQAQTTPGAPPSQAKPAAPQPAPGAGNSRALIVVGVAVAALASGAVWLFAAGSADGRVEDAMERLQDAVRSKLGAASPRSPAAEPLEKAGTALPSAARAGQQSGASRAGQPHRERVAAGTTALAASMLAPIAPLEDRELPPIRPAPRLSTVFYERVAVMASAPAGEGTIEPDGRRIYSSADAGIVPPRAVYPQLPANPPPGAWTANRTILELVVATDGLVERVRLRTTPRNIHEFMLLSAAKAWRFDPAVREDGSPVRFRHRVVLTQP